MECMLYQHFRLPGHNFNIHSKFALIEQLLEYQHRQGSTNLQVKKQEDFWIQKLKTLQTDGFRAKLNFPNP